jgi:hypothetical protein
MPRSLIISDRPHQAYAAESVFARSGWSSISIGVDCILSIGRVTASNYQCLLFVLDADFECRFSSLFLEIGAFVRNCSKQTSLYFLIEGSDDTSFIPWLENGKTIFKFTSNLDGIHQAIERIIWNESSPAFFSPMDSI